MSATIGLDVHKDTIAAARLDSAGRVRAQHEFDNTPDGHHALVRWADGHGTTQVGLEPSGGIGTAAAATLAAAGAQVMLVPPRMSARQARRTQRGKTDASDAIAIARVVQQQPVLPPFQPDQEAHDLKLLVDYRDQLAAERTRIGNRIHADLAIAYPGYQRRIGRALTSKSALAAVEQLLASDHSVRAQLVRRRLARLREIDAEQTEIKDSLELLVDRAATSLEDSVGVSTIVAARLLGEIGDITRFRSADAFAASNGTAPIPASSGRTDRHRFNRGGNRRLNRALYVIALTQSRHEPRAREYLARKQAEGKTRREAIRCLKRQLARTIYTTLKTESALT